MDGIEESEGRGGVKFFLLGLPVLLVISIVGAIWFHWYKETEEVADPGLAMGGEGIERGEVEDSLRKFTEYIGKREWGTAEGRGNIRKAIALIEGTLSPQNYGFVVQEGAEVSYEGELWPLVWVDVEGSERKDEVVIIAAAYDWTTDPGATMSLLTAARVLRSMQLERTVRIIFCPEMIGIHPDTKRPKLGEFLQKKEDCVCFLRLVGMGSAQRVKDDGETKVLAIYGSELADADEPKVRDLEVNRVVTNKMEGNASDYGTRAVARYQQVEPVGKLESLPDELGLVDVDALIEQTRVLVRVVAELAGME